MGCVACRTERPHERVPAGRPQCRATTGRSDNVDERESRRGPRPCERAYWGPPTLPHQGTKPGTTPPPDPDPRPGARVQPSTTYSMMGRIRARQNIELLHLPEAWPCCAAAHATGSTASARELTCSPSRPLLPQRFWSILADPPPRSPPMVDALIAPTTTVYNGVGNLIYRHRQDTRDATAPAVLGVEFTNLGGYGRYLPTRRCGGA